VRLSREDWRNAAGPGVYPVALAGWLLSPLRRLLLSPAEQARRLDVLSGMDVLEIGSGPGWFAPEFARRAGSGKLTLLDLQPGMLALARKRLQRSGFPADRLVTGRAEALPFRSEIFDRILLSTVLGETADPLSALREAERVLRTDGRLCVSEARGDPDRVSRRRLLGLTGACRLQPERIWEGPLILSVRFRKTVRGS